MATKALTKLTPKKGAAVKRPGTARNTAAPKGVTWHAAFLAELADSCNVTGAARAAGISREAAYEHRKGDPAFAAAWEDAIEQAIEKLEHAARQRALTVSDTLAIFLLKAHRPKVYRENQAAGTEDDPVHHKHSVEYINDWRRSSRTDG